MSDMPGDDPERNSGLTALYRTFDRDEPPTTLDDAIRATAKRAVLSKPRLAGSPVRRSWRVAMSIAAVLVLSASLVALMREEAPEVAELPRADAPTTGVGRGSAGSTASGRADANVQSAPVPEAHKLGGTELQPLPHRTRERAGAGVDERAPAAATRDSQANDKYEVESRSGASAVRESSTDAVATEPASPKSAPEPAAKRKPAQAFSNSAVRDKSNAAGESPRSAAQATATSPPLGLAAKALSEPAPRTAGTIESIADQPPEKWIERIEELRKSGRLAEARESLTEFKKRYPNYVLPSSLDHGIQP